MMNRVEREKLNQRRWQERFSHERMKLSASLEEALIDTGEDDGDEFDDRHDGFNRDAEAKIIRPRLSLQSKPLPAVRVLSHPAQSQEVDEATGLTSETGAAQATPGKKRLAGRNTRVELQAIPRQEKKPARKTKPLAEPVKTITVLDVLPGQETITGASSAVRVSSLGAREKLSGRAMILKGKAEALVENSHVTAASVVLVSLLNNPGQVVVLYFTLLPGYGFTVHLSAEVASDTAFNYVVLLGELL